MRGLLSRLSELDAGMGDAVRIIAFFDELVTRGASPDMLVRSAAALAECPVGLLDPGAGLLLRSTPAGEVPPPSGDGGPGPALLAELSATGPVHTGDRLLCPVLRDGAVAAVVWLERQGAYGSDEELLVERLAHAAAVVLERARPRTAAPGTRACLEALVAASAGDEERAVTLRALGLSAEGTVTLLAVASAALPAALARLDARTTAARTAALGDVGLVLVPGPAVAVDDVLAAIGRERGPAPSGVRVGVGPTVTPLRAHESWTAARLALRFTGPPEPAGAPAVVRHDALGVLALLAHVPAAHVAADGDVAAVARLADTPGSPSDLAVLAALCGSGSLREAAAGLHLHHSTVAHRVRRIERALGYGLDTPDGRTRARVALLLHRAHTA